MWMRLVTIFNLANFLANGMRPPDLSQYKMIRLKVGDTIDISREVKSAVELDEEFKQGSSKFFKVNTYYFYFQIRTVPSILCHLPTCPYLQIRLSLMNLLLINKVMNDRHRNPSSTKRRKEVKRASTASISVS
jgi:hypothetical protein